MDTLKLVYTQSEAFDLIDEYTEAYKNKIKQLEAENTDLKSELSKFRDSFKKYRDYEKEELAESCYDLARENQKLKEEIGKLVMKQ